MRTTEQKLKHKEYMREYYKKNKKHILQQTKEREAKKSDEWKANRLKQHRASSQKYDNNNRKKINERQKNNNWYYMPERGKERRAQYQKIDPVKVLLYGVKSRAKKKKLQYNLDIEWYINEFKKGCAMTGLRLEYSGSKSPWTVHIDRIVPKNGYIKENCRLVCACYNIAKKNWLDSDVLRMARALIQKVDGIE